VSTAAGTGPILFVGLGSMGAPMASRLATAGHEVLLHDVDGDRARALAGRTGARAVDTLAASAPTVAVAVLMLPDSTAVETVLLGERGLLATLGPGAVVVDMGSSRPGSSVQLAATAAGRGIGWLDAPVSGGVTRAGDGSLAVMVGGEQAVLDRVRPVLAVLGSDVTLVGSAGSGHAMKALNNLLSAIGLVAASEVVSVGSNFGLDPQVMLDVLNRSTGRNHATEVKMARFVLSRSFDSGFPLDLMVKDLRTAVDLAHETATPVPLAASCLEEWAAASRSLPSSADHTQVAAYVESRAGIRLQ